jgi:hypothetical protein
VTPAQQFAVSAVFDGTDSICTVPTQISPFRLKLIHFLYAASVAVAARQLFVRIRFGGAVDIFNWSLTTSVGPTVGTQFHMNAGEGFSYDFQNPSTTNRTVTIPLPLDLVLDSQAVITFGCRNSDVADVLSESSVMLDFL